MEQENKSSYKISVSERNEMKKKILKNFPKMKEFMEQEEWWESIEEMRSETQPTKSPNTNRETKMDNNYSHYRCSVIVRKSEDRKFEFIVPQHSVDKDGVVDYDILQEITDKFEDDELSFENCKEEFSTFIHRNTDVFGSSDGLVRVLERPQVSPISNMILIESGCNYRDEDQNYVSYHNQELPSSLEVFGENK